MSHENDLTNAQAAMDASTMNGLLAVVGMLKKKGVIDNVELEKIHDAMNKPLHLPGNATNNVVQMWQQKIDDIFSVFYNEL